MTGTYYDYYVGADFGQVNDYTALAILEEPVWSAVRGGWISLGTIDPPMVHHLRGENWHHGRPPWPPLHLRHLERLRQVPYGDIVQRLSTLLAMPPLAAASVCLIVDHTGVGRGVLDWLVAAGLQPLGCTITGGNHVSYDPPTNLVTCPKRDLVVATQAALQNNRLRIAPGLEHAPTLVNELKNYRVKISAAGHDSYDAREGQHDDLVLATAMAVWWRDWWHAAIETHHATVQRGAAG